MYPEKSAKSGTANVLLFFSACFLFFFFSCSVAKVLKTSINSLHEDSQY